MSELSRRSKRSKSDATIYCFCESCDRVLYVDAGSLFCPVCSSPVLALIDQDSEISLPEASETPST